MLDYLWELMDEGKDKEEIFVEIMEYVMEKEMEYGYEELTLYEKKSFMLGILFYEVDQGGFDQYFVKTSANYVKETVDFLDLIGVVELPALLEEAYSIYKAVIPDDKKLEEYHNIDFKFFRLKISEKNELFEKFVDYLKHIKIEE